METYIGGTLWQIEIIGKSIIDFTDQSFYFVSLYYKMRQLLQNASVQTKIKIAAKHKAL